MSYQNVTLMHIYHLFDLYFQNAHSPVPKEVKQAIHNSLHITISDQARYFYTLCDHTFNAIDNMCIIEVKHENFIKLKKSYRLLPEDDELLLLPDGRMLFVKFVSENERTALQNFHNMNDKYGIQDFIFHIVNFVQSVLKLDSANILTKKTDTVVKKVYDMTPLYMAFLIINNHFDVDYVSKNTWICIFRKYFTAYIRYNRVRDEYFEKLYDTLIKQGKIEDITFDANTIYSIFRSCLQNPNMVTEIEV